MESMSPNLISFDDAKRMASSRAESYVGKFRTNPSANILSEMYLEADYCWMFFVDDKTVRIPDQYSLRKGAYVISKKGTFSHTADFDGDQEKLMDYVKVMSNYFRDKGL